MKEPPSINRFLARYFPVFMGTIFMAIFSGSAAVSMAGVTYLRGVDPALKANYSVGAILVLVAALVFGNVMIARGYPWATRLVAAYLGACLLFALPMIQYDLNKLVYGSAVLVPLLGLLLLNSKRHREMRKKLSEIRHLRQAAIAKRKAR
ncbi:lipoprotein [Pseudomonas paralactis]|uniref:Lipoprotein n=3 Tax=Pseudomonas TaxID=286 RepID=A0A0R3ASR1_9PSED|nr:lipoprotein [Pseudomonas paralactis]